MTPLPQTNEPPVNQFLLEKVGSKPKYSNPVSAKSSESSTQRYRNSKVGGKSQSRQFEDFKNEEMPELKPQQVERA